MSYHPLRVHYEERPRAAGRLVLGLALSGALALTFIAISLYQLTGESIAEAALRDALNALAEGDAVVARNYEDLQARAEASPPGEMVELRDYPVAIPLSRDEALASSEDDITDILLDRGADALYEDGTDALRGDGASDGAGSFTAAGAVGEFMGFLRSDVHAILAVLMLVLAGISVVLAIILVGLCRGFGRVVALGGAAAVASIPLLLGGVGAHFYASASAGSESEYVRHEFMEIAQNLALLPVRNGIAVLIASVALVIAGAICARVSDARRV